MPQSAIDKQRSSAMLPEGHLWEMPKVRPGERADKAAQNPRIALRVFIVDRDSMSSNLLASVLCRDRRCQAEAIQPSDLLGTLATREADLVVIGVDLNSISGSGFDLAHAVSRSHPNINIAMLLSYASRELVINAFRSGAHGVLTRDLGMDEFLDGIEHVGRGFIWAGRQETKCLLEAFKSIPAPNVLSACESPSLTARELQVVQHAAKGKTNKTIANELRLSEHTVKNYLFRAFEKLGVKSRVELLFYLTIRGHSFSPIKADAVDADSRIADTKFPVSRESI